MFTVLFYGGIILGALLFVAAVILFFALRIPRVMGYFAKTKGSGIGAAEFAAPPRRAPVAKGAQRAKASGKAAAPMKRAAQTEGDVTVLLSDEVDTPTELLSQGGLGDEYGEGTVLLDAAQDGDSVTELLDDNATELLEDEQATEILDEMETELLDEEDMPTELLG